MEIEEGHLNQIDAYKLSCLSSEWINQIDFL